MKFECTLKNNKMELISSAYSDFKKEFKMVVWFTVIALLLIYIVTSIAIKI